MPSSGKKGVGGTKMEVCGGGRRFYGVGGVAPRGGNVWEWAHLKFRKGRDFLEL